MFVYIITNEANEVVSIRLTTSKDLTEAFECAEKITKQISYMNDQKLKVSAVLEQKIYDALSVE